MLNLIGDAPDIKSVVLLNQAFGEGSDWVLWYGDNRLGVAESGSRRRLREANGIEISIPKLRPAVLVLLDLKSEHFTPVLGSAETLLAAHHKQYLRTWLNDVDAAMRPLEGRLGI